MGAIPRFPFRKLRRPFISNYITLDLFLLSRRKGFATVLSVVVITDIKLVFSSFKTVICLVWKTLFRVDVVRVKFTSFYVRAVMLAMSAKPLGIFLRACVSTWLVIGHLTVSDICKFLNNVALYVLMSVLASSITLPQLSNLKWKKLFTFNGSNLHSIIIFILLI